MVRTVLHIGAHKTATTYMQKMLAINIDQLNALGIHYDPLEVLRRNFSGVLQDPDNGDPAFIEALKRKIKTQDVIISEENLAGMPGDIVRSGVYYAHTRKRLKHTIEILDVTSPEIFMALREYSGFTVSMYCEYLRHREFMPFAEYLEIYRNSKFSWINVVADVVAAGPAGRIRLWDFGKFRAAEKEVFSAMLGRDVGFLQAPEGPVRESFSETTIRALELLSGIMTHRELKSLVGPISRAVPKGDAHKAFNPLPQDVVAEMKEQYRQDLQAIKARFPAVEFIGG
jgi:hypothetical protein